MEPYDWEAEHDYEDSTPYELVRLRREKNQKEREPWGEGMSFLLVLVAILAAAHFHVF